MFTSNRTVRAISANSQSNVPFATEAGYLTNSNGARIPSLPDSIAALLQAFFVAYPLGTLSYNDAGAAALTSAEGGTKLFAWKTNAKMLATVVFFIGGKDAEAKQRALSDSLRVDVPGCECLIRQPKPYLWVALPPTISDDSVAALLRHAHMHAATHGTAGFSAMGPVEVLPMPDGIASVAPSAPKEKQAKGKRAKHAAA